VLLQVEAQHLADPAQPELGGAVRRAQGQAEQAGGRRHVDDVPTGAGLDHGRGERRHEVDGPHQVDLDAAAPVVRGEVLDAAPGRDAGDVHEHVDGSAGQGAPGEGHDGVGVGHVERLVVHDAVTHQRDRGLEALGGMSVSTTRAPLATTCRVAACPMPLPAPVITTVLLSNEVLVICAPGAELPVTVPAACRADGLSPAAGSVTRSSPEQ
jgi:hypothetical protein